MSTTDHEGPEMSNGPYTGMSVKDLEMNLGLTRNALDNLRRRRDRIKAEIKIARAREASEPKPIPENPGWDVFDFNAKLTSDDRVRVYTGTQEDGRIAVVAGELYWFFDDWEGFISWFRDPELVTKTSPIRPLTRPSGVAGVSIR